MTLREKRDLVSRAQGRPLGLRRGGRRTQRKNTERRGEEGKRREGKEKEMTCRGRELEKRAQSRKMERSEVRNCEGEKVTYVSEVYDILLSMFVGLAVGRKRVCFLDIFRSVFRCVLASL